jgi:hypothetical protein
MPPYLTTRIHGLSYRAEAAQLRDMAAKSSPEARKELLTLALQYDVLADSQDLREGRATTG